MMDHNSVILNVEDGLGKTFTHGRITSPYLSKYERAKIIGFRATQLSNNDPPRVAVGDNIDFINIAKEELKQGVLDFVIRRPLPNGKYEDWLLSELRVDSIYFQ